MIVTITRHKMLLMQPRGRRFNVSLSKSNVKLTVTHDVTWPVSPGDSQQESKSKLLILQAGKSAAAGSLI